MKRAALYLRVSTVDQHPETQVYDLRQMAAQRGYEIVQEYVDRISGAKARIVFGLGVRMGFSRPGIPGVNCIPLTKAGCPHRERNSR